MLSNEPAEPKTTNFRTPMIQLISSMKPPAIVEPMPER